MAKRIELTYGDIVSLTGDSQGEIKIAVAVSGGRDSVALLHCLKNIQDENAHKTPAIKVSAINVEHGIRGESSKRDSEFVRSLCEEWEIPLYSYCVDVPAYAKENGYTEEQAGRILRYEIFDRLISDKICDYVALAHHLDDQAETVFMRILRGTGIRGLEGMKKASGRYIRPFLDYTREDVDCYVILNDLPYVDDETNDDVAYTRNYLRTVLSDLKKRYPSLCEAVARLSESAREANQFIDAHIPEIEVYDGVSYIKTSDCANTLIAKRLIFKACSALGVTQDIEDRHYGLILGLIGAPSGKYLNLTHGLRVYREGDKLAFTVATEPNDLECAFSEGEFSDLGISVKRAELCDVKFGEGALFIDGDKLPVGAVIRTRREGDVIRKFGGGSKSLGDFLTDKKIPLRVRDSLMLIAKDSEVYAVFGVDISSKVKIDEDSKLIYELKILDKNNRCTENAPNNRI